MRDIKGCIYKSNWSFDWLIGWEILSRKEAVFVDCWSAYCDLKNGTSCWRYDTFVYQLFLFKF